MSKDIPIKLQQAVFLLWFDLYILFNSLNISDHTTLTAHPSSISGR